MSVKSSRNRGKRKPKLRDLGVNPLTLEETNALLDAIGAATAPITMGSLRRALRRADRGRLSAHPYTVSIAPRQRNCVLVMQLCGGAWL
jgi:hypothetical protein